VYREPAGESNAVMQVHRGGMTNERKPNQIPHFSVQSSTFVIRHSFVIGHSSLGIEPQRIDSVSDTALDIAAGPGADC
jgi:hypothetical protein